jgi:mono/diheme cytochrome c family protein
MRSLIVLCLVVASVSFAQKKAEEPKRSLSVERGKYLVENIANCTQCHTPRESSGDLIRAKLFDGAAVPVGKPSWANTWAEFAPRIAGLPQYSDEQAVKLLSTGIGREGKPLRAPMPVFRMTQQDAQDVVMYLKSLGQ